MSVTLCTVHFKNDFRSSHSCPSQDDVDARFKGSIDCQAATKTDLQNGSDEILSWKLPSTSAQSSTETLIPSSSSK